MDIFKAYLLTCLALGTLRVVQGWRWSSGRSITLREFWLGLDACWVFVSVCVLAQASVGQIKGVAIWYALGTLGGWLMLRPRVRITLPDWYQEYTLFFGLGLTGTTAIALTRYTVVEPWPFPQFLSEPVGFVWLIGFAVLSARTLFDFSAGLMQRSYDQAVLGGLKDHPRCGELFGDIRQILRKHEESSRVTGEDVLVYRVEGSRAAGVVVAEFRAAGESVNEVVQGLVYMDTGERSSLNVGSANSS